MEQIRSPAQKSSSTWQAGEAAQTHGEWYFILSQLGCFHFYAVQAVSASRRCLQQHAAGPQAYFVLEGFFFASFPFFSQVKLLLSEQFLIGLMNLNLDKPSLKMNLVQVDHQQQKPVSRWVPQSLTEDQKLGRVKWCNFMLKILMKANQRLFLILLWVTKLGFTSLIQKQNGNLLFGALQNHLILRRFAELEVLEKMFLKKMKTSMKLRYPPRLAKTDVDAKLGFNNSCFTSRSSKLPVVPPGDAEDAGFGPLTRVQVRAVSDLPRADTLYPIL
ncbi:hypothetical protein LAZ67_9001084 [Cordylochernes scorpioides]|uniref:Uncharacterized protein n=1 Tax=Cordylochernes scorpioides TaxID=51811 RepID=A0ABY6KXT9_9ARAC|nr:hypothetical protein LAZ67_9001084 [Cordylochernes scorpioides]